MNDLFLNHLLINRLPILLASLAILGAVTAILLYRHRTRRIMQTMSAMLDEAIAGRFLESHFDESLLSAVETKLAGYLGRSRVSAQNLADEKDKIKELISDISHQTKTPVANILLYSQLLGEQDLPPESAACVNSLIGQTEKLNFLIQSLVKISRLETGIISLAPQPGHLASLLNQVVSQAIPKAEQKDIAIVAAPTDATAVFDGKWTAEALANILDNAVKYTPKGGAIHIQVHPYELFCRITVTDTGMGIPEEEQAKIFQRFYRSPSVKTAEGVGIGLYLARQIISEEGGYIKVASVVGKGSTFSIFLPR